MELPEAQQIALESSGELLPPDALVQRIQRDLKAIRSHYPEVADVKHTPKWQPGKLMVQNVKKEALDKINSSPYGPSEANAIFQETIFLVKFKKPYNPEKLAELLKKELGIEEAKPDNIIGSSSSITLTCGANDRNTYVLFKGSGDSFSGCINKTYWTFVVGPEEHSVQLLEHSEANPNSEGGSDQPVGIGMFSLD